MCTATLGQAKLNIPNHYKGWDQGLDPGTESYLFPKPPRSESGSVALKLVSVIWQQPRVRGTGRREPGNPRWGSKVCKFVSQGCAPSGRYLALLERSILVPRTVPSPTPVPEAWSNSHSLPRCASCIPSCLPNLEQ